MASFSKESRCLIFFPHKTFWGISVSLDLTSFLKCQETKSCICYLSGFVIKYYDQNNLWKKMFTLAHVSRGIRAHHGWETWQQAGMVAWASSGERSWKWSKALNSQGLPKPAQWCTSSNKAAPLCNLSKQHQHHQTACERYLSFKLPQKAKYKTS